MLKAQGICKRYRKKQVLDHVGICAGPGECIGIVGANGCGKTTLLAILAGAVTADAGSILYDGEEAVGHPWIFSRKAAYVPQENPLMEELSVRDNLRLWYRGNKRAFAQDLERGVFSMLQIGEVIRKPVRLLSGGMKRRVSIACALSCHAGVLIMDEPGAALDLECKEAIRAYLKAYLAEGKTVIFTSHEIEELSICTKLYILKDGKLRETEVGICAKELLRLC